MPAFNVLLKIYEEIFFRSLLNVKYQYKFNIFNFKLQMKIQITQQHNKSKSKNTYRIKYIILKSKI